MELKGLFVSKIDRQTAINLFDDLIKEFDLRATISPLHETDFRKLLCNKLSNAIHKCFECDMYGPRQCLNRIQAISSNNDHQLYVKDIKEIIQITFNLKNILNNIIPFNEFPSCKDLLNISATDAVSEVNKSNNNSISKGIISGGLLTKTTIDANKIVNIELFYTILKAETESEIKAENRNLNEIESFILSKCNEELMYCQQARGLTGLRLDEEINNILNGTNSNIHLPLR